MFKTLILLTEHFFIPGIFLFWNWKRIYKSKFDGLYLSLLVGVYVFYIYLVGDWHIFGYYFKYLWTGAFVIVLVRTIYTIRYLPFWVRKNPKEKFGLYFTGLFVVIFSILGLWAYWGSFVNKEGAVSLALPLKNGSYYVIEGGDSPLINNHHHFFSVPEKYSVEFVKLDKSGKYARSFFPNELAAFEIFGEKVYSPCSGTVVSVVDTFPDLKPSQLENQKSVFWGNSVMIDYQGTYVVLARLKQNSITLHRGDRVEAGQFIGKVGNSGFIGGPFSINLEPHLHIHAMRKSEREDFPFEHEGVPILFEGQFLSRNTLVKVQ